MVDHLEYFKIMINKETSSSRTGSFLGIKPGEPGEEDLSTNLDGGRWASA